MNNNSEICKELQIIQSTLTNRFELPDEKDPEHVQLLNVFRDNHPDIKIKVELPLAIFNYRIEADFTNPVVQEARGIIINLDTLDVVCWPFRKFGRYDEPYADNIDWSTAKVQEKIDGSIIKLWFNELIGEWQFSSNSMFRTEDAPIDQISGRTLMDIIRETPEYKGFDAEKGSFFHEKELDKSTTYILELTSPENHVVVPYNDYHLRHIGTRNNITGEESRGYIGLSVPIEYDIQTIQDCLSFVTRMNKNTETGKISSVTSEGFVVVDGNWNRVKVKTSEYMIMHHLVSITKESKKQLVELLLNDNLDITGLCECFPRLTHILYYYAYQVAEMRYKATAMIDITRRLFKESGGNRKTVAMKIKSNAYAPFGFAALNDMVADPETIINRFGFANLIKYIKDYDIESMKYLLVPDDAVTK